MPLHELNGEPRATLGDGKNWVSVQYRDVPQGFRIRDVNHRLTDSFVTVPTAFTAEMWAALPRTSTSRCMRSWATPSRTSWTA